jgi:hypothetical protein
VILEYNRKSPKRPQIDLNPPLQRADAITVWTTLSCAVAVCSWIIAMEWTSGIEFSYTGTESSYAEEEFSYT